MLPGPTIIKKCLKCSGLIEEHTIESGNTFGAIFWTDGKRDAPMLPDQPWLVKCPHCQTLLWIDEQEEVTEIEPFGDDGEYKGAKSYSLPCLQDYFDELAKNNLNREKEPYVRVRLWWVGNDKRRDDNNVKQNMSSKEEENLQALIKMLGSSDDDRIMKAEIMRELKEFEGAMELLKKPFTDELSQVALMIGKLAKSRNPFVAKIKFED